MWPVLALLLLADPTPPPGLALVGVVRAAAPGRSIAVIEASGDSRVVGTGEAAFGGRVEHIGEDSVALAFGATRLELSLSDASRSAGAAAATDPSVESDGLVMDRAQLQQRLAVEASRIVAETTLVPVSDEEGVAGLALTRLPEGTLLSEAGLQAGDVLVSINGVKVDSMATLAALWGQLQSAGAVEAGLLRDGRPVSLRVLLR